MKKQKPSSSAAKPVDNSSGREEQPGKAPRGVGFVLLLIVILAALGLGVLIGRRHGDTQGPRAKEAGGKIFFSKPGPWGELEFVPITIAAPTELLSVHEMEERPIEWFLGGYTRQMLASFLEGKDISAAQREELLDPTRMRGGTNGLVLVPSKELVLGLPKGTRDAIFQLLAIFQENDAIREVVLASDLDEMFQGSRVTQETIARLREYSYPHGRYLFCFCEPAVLSRIPTYEEKADFFRGLSRVKTLLVRLHVTANSDINGLTAYWGKACWSTDVKALLESLAKIPSGANLDIIELLPPFPTSLLYTYPVPQNPIEGPVVKKDCHWTSLNFFRDPPDRRFNEPDYCLEKLKTEYYPVHTDARYGDVVLFMKPNGNIIHSAVFLADDIVYTKNGDNVLQPWKFSTISDLLDLYSFDVGADQKLTVTYMRNKYY